MGDSRERELAFSILWKILNERGGRSSWSSLRLESFKQSQDILGRHDIDVSEYLDRVLKQFPRDKATGDVLLPTILKKPEPPDKIAKEIISKLKPTKAPPPNMVSGAKMYYEMRDKMLDVNQYLSKWGDDSKGVLSDLNLSSKGKKFINKFDNPPATFEFVVGKSLCILFETPLLVEYKAPILPREKSCVVWRGRSKGYSPIEHAPGGGPDAIVYARGYYGIVEATLRYTKAQWKEEVEPIFRHTGDFIEEMNLDPSDVYLVFVTPSKVLEGTYKWIHSRAEEYCVIALDTQNLSRLVRTSLFINGLPHAEIRRAFQSLRKRLIDDIVVDTYLEHASEDINEWCEEALLPYLDLFLAIKTYEVVRRRKGLSKITKVINDLSKDPEIKDYIVLGGIAKVSQVKKVLLTKKRSLLRYLSLFGLAREIDGHLSALPPDEFDNRFLKMYGHIKKIAEV
jgi:hypothetical protein